MTDWADTVADALMARANVADEPLETARHLLAGALRAEREACAKIAEDAAPPMVTPGPHAEGQRMTSAQVAAAIRARSKE